MKRKLDEDRIIYVRQETPGLKQSVMTLPMMLTYRLRMAKFFFSRHFNFSFEMICPDQEKGYGR